MKTCIVKHWQVILIIVLALTAVTLSYFLVKIKHNEKPYIYPADSVYQNRVDSMSKSELWQIIGSDFDKEARRLDSLKNNDDR